MEEMTLLASSGLVMVGDAGEGAVERNVRIWLRMLARLRLREEALVVVADVHFPRLRFVECCAVVRAWPFRVCGN